MRRQQKLRQRQQPNSNHLAATLTIIWYTGCATTAANTTANTTGGTTAGATTTEAATTLAATTAVVSLHVGNHLHGVPPVHRL